VPFWIGSTKSPERAGLLLIVILIVILILIVSLNNSLLPPSIGPSSRISESDVPRVDIQQFKASFASEHRRDVEGVRPPIAKEFAERLVVFFHDLRLKIRNLRRQLGAGEVQDERTIDDRHFDREKLFIRVGEFRNRMTCDREDSFGL
jgi:hypothetical protein